MQQVNLKFQAANDLVKDSFQQTTARLLESVDRLEVVSSPYKAYLKDNGQFLLDMLAHYEQLQRPDYFQRDFEDLLKENHDLYKDVTKPGYDTSFVNPTYSVEVFGKAMGQFLSSVAYRFRTCVGLVYEGRLFEIHGLIGQYLYLYETLLSEDEPSLEAMENGIRALILADLETNTVNGWVRRLSSSFDAYSYVAESCDLDDLRYLFRYGMYIGDNELALANYVATLSDEKQQKIADTYTEAYIRGFKRKNIPLDKKKSLSVTYHLGFERIVRKAYSNFEKIGLKPFVFYHLREVQRPRLYNTRPNRQMTYDHRFSDGFLLNEAYVDAVIEANKKALKSIGGEAKAYSGLGLFEIFGEEPFEPVNHEANVVYDDLQMKLSEKLQREVQMIYRQYVQGSDYSFTINDYPLPSIGKDFEAIFEATIEVNTLDEELYQTIQATIIEALDSSEYVRVTGRDGNETDIKVFLRDLENPEKESKFKNCTADVNVPVGEVYTSPRLKGTEGLLHVKEVYLKGLKYTDLRIRFEDGMIIDYNCGNFDTDHENRNFVRETLMHPHNTLPLGEFAIGTNTVAYKMARDFGIQKLLPILIGEKTGPHFAIGDTCFVWSEDNPVFNPDGKEMTARENERTCLRNSEPEKAYTYKHTDITIPYDELGTILGHGHDGVERMIIDEGRFVLPGTEVLNGPLDEE